MRRFELNDRRWAIGVDGNLVKIAWGRVGGHEQRHDRKLADDDAAAAYAAIQIAKQRELGYVESVSAPVVAPPPPIPDHPPISRSIRFEIAAEQKTSYRRYPKPARFHAIEQRDHAVTEVIGELADAANAESRSEKFATIAAASEAYDDIVQSAREDSWREVCNSQRAIAKTNRELEAQCIAAGDDPAPWAVYADWLLTEGDVCGTIAACPDDREALQLFSSQLSGFAGGREVDLAIERIHGFPRRVTIRIADPGGANDPIYLADVAHEVCSGVGRFIDSLRFGLAGYSSANDWAPVLRALAELPHPERIRELRFDAFDYQDCEISWATMGNLTGLFAPFTALELLHIKSGAGGTLGDLDLPTLRTFIRESGGLSAAEVAAISLARWPKLEHLEIWFGSTSYGADSTVASIASILAADGLPALRHLGIVNCEWVEDAIDALARSPVLRQLDSLDLSKGILARRGAALLVEYAPAFRHLASLDLSANLLDDDQIAQVRRVLDNVIVCDQREIEFDDYEQAEADGERTRYVAVGE